MKPLNLVALLLFLLGTIWVLTLSERSVRAIQKVYYSTLSPFLKGGSEMKAKADLFLEETQNSKDLENKLTAKEELYEGLRSQSGRLNELERENEELRAALEFKKQQSLKLIAARIIKRQPSTWWETAIIDRGEKFGHWSGGAPPRAGRIGWEGRHRLERHLQRHPLDGRTLPSLGGGAETGRGR